MPLRVDLSLPRVSAPLFFPAVMATLITLLLFMPQPSFSDFLDAGIDFTGDLLIQNSRLEDLATYDLSDSGSSVLYDEDPFTGLDVPSSGRYFTFRVDLSSVFSIQDIYIQWQVPDENSALASSNSFIKYLDPSGSTDDWIPVNSNDISNNGPTQQLGNYYVVYQWQCGVNSNCTRVLASGIEVLLATEGYDSNNAKVTAFEVRGVLPPPPTPLPTRAPTTPAPTAPSAVPSVSPTKGPSVSPTLGPTNAPTYEAYLMQTPRGGLYAEQSSFKWSDNLYPLAERNMTYATFRVPGNEPFCATCILAWTNIDATVRVEGCDNLDYGLLSQDGRVVQPGEFYYCEGTWVLETTATLVGWQKTYGRLEIWEVDDFGRKYQHEFFEFQWNSSNCTWTDENTGIVTECDLLPLSQGYDKAARFEWTMPKLVTDNRDRPLIVVWYDLLSVPYALRPVLNETYLNFTFTDLNEGAPLGFEDVVETFQIPIIAAGGLLLGFIVIMIIACIAADEAILKQDYMVDTRDIRSTYIHSINTLIAPQSELQTRARFNMKRHGFWLFLVLAFRLAYMFVFTFWFFGLVFEYINKDSFDVLDQYSNFADQRDDQIKNFSVGIEAYYYNETNRMEDEIEQRDFYCNGMYKYETDLLYQTGAIEQYNNHSLQMENSLNGINLANVSSGMYISGNTACSIDESSGAEILSRDPYAKLITDDDGAYVNTTYMLASDYDRSVTTGPNNFTYIEQFFTSVCETTRDCVGWTFIDAQFDNASNTSLSNAYYFLSELGDPVNSGLKGLCYAQASFDSSLYDFSSVNALANYSNYLENLYLSEYESDVDDMFEMLSGVWDALKEITSTDEDDAIEVVINPDATSYDMHFDVNFKIEISSGNSQTNTSTTSKSFIIFDCPGCPTGNLTNAYLQQITDYFYSYNYTNISDFVSDVAGSTNVSDYVSVDTAWIEYPEIPEIDLPFDIDLPSMTIFELISALSLGLDALLFIYRWYRTAGIVAAIVRGKDVEIRLKYLKTEQAPTRRCWSGRECADKCLNCIIWCHDHIRHCGYNLWKFTFWIMTLLQLSILVLIIVIAYVLLDAVMTEEFFISLGTFNLLTIGIAAQRSIRNEVIATTALGYNNYTLELLEEGRISYAEDKNEDAWQQNKDELQRVDDYNAYFCSAYTSYQATPRDVTRDCGCSLQTGLDTNFSGTSAVISDMFDGDESTFWGVRAGDAVAANTDAWIELELPAIQMTRDSECYWLISQIAFDWRFYANGSNAATLNVAEFDIYAKANSSDAWEQQALETNVFQVPSETILSDIDQNNVNWLDTTRFVGILLKNVDTWTGTLFLNEISFTGYAPEDCIACQRVTFYYWDFDAFDTYVELCPVVTPVHGIMYRGWVRTWLTAQLIEGHGPFIRAIRNIVLSPFAILLVGTITLVVAYIIAFMVEWILLKVNLYRENPYTKVPLVHAKNSEFYDPELHDVDEPSNRLDKSTYFGNSQRNLSKGLKSVDSMSVNEIERNASQEMRKITKRRNDNKDGRMARFGKNKNKRKQGREGRMDSDEAVAAYVARKGENKGKMPPPPPRQASKGRQRGEIGERGEPGNDAVVVYGGGPPPVPAHAKKRRFMV